MKEIQCVCDTVNERTSTLSAHALTSASSESDTRSTSSRCASHSAQCWYPSDVFRSSDGVAAATVRRQFWNSRSVFRSARPTPWPQSARTTSLRQSFGASAAEDAKEEEEEEEDEEEEAKPSPQRTNAASAAGDGGSDDDDDDDDDDARQNGERGRGSSRRPARAGGRNDGADARAAAPAAAARAARRRAERGMRRARRESNDERRARAKGFILLQ